MSMSSHRLAFQGLLCRRLFQCLSAAAPVGVALRGQRQALAPAAAPARQAAPPAAGRPQGASRIRIRLWLTGVHHAVGEEDCLLILLRAWSKPPCLQ